MELPPESHPAETRRAELALLGVIIAWGMNFAVVKGALTEFLPLSFNATRFAIASVALWLIASFRGIDLRVPRSLLFKIAIIGVMQTTLYQILFIEGIARTTAGNSAMILSTTPAIVSLLSWLLGREKLNRWTATGVVLAFSGLYFVISAGGKTISLSSTTLTGDLLTLLATLLWSLYTIFAQPFFTKVEPLKFTTLATLLGSIPLLVWCTPALLAQNWHAISPAGWSGMLFSGLIAIAISFIIWNYSIAKVGPTRTAIYSNLIPVVAVITGVLFLHERLRPLQIFGAVLVLSGILLTRIAARQPKSEK